MFTFLKLSIQWAILLSITTLIAGCTADSSARKSQFVPREDREKLSGDLTDDLNAKPGGLDRAEIMKRKSELSHRPLTTQVTLGASAPFWGYRCLSYRVEIPVYDPVKRDWETIEAIYVVPRAQFVLEQGTVGFVISPNISGTNPLEVRLAAIFCKNNMAAIYPARSVDYSVEPSTYPGWDTLNQNMKRNIARMKTLADFLEQQPEIRHIGAAGGSLGGIMTSLFAGVDERVEAGIIIAGGGDLAKVIAESNVPTLQKIRKRQMEFLENPTLENYEEKLRSSFRYDPLVFASLARTENLFMGIVQGDDSVSTEQQWVLWEALGRPKYDQKEGPHVWGISKYVFHTQLQEAITFVTRKIYPE